MQQCSDLRIYNQASKMVLSILLRQAALKIEQIVVLLLDKVRRWREGIDNEGLTVVVSNLLSKLRHYRIVQRKTGLPPQIIL